MKKYNVTSVVFALLFFACFHMANAKASCDCKKLYEISNENGIGFIDCKGKIVVKPMFQESQPFNDGVAAVIINSKIVSSNENGTPTYEFTSGIVHLDGRVITLPNTWITNFSEGLAFARVSGKFVYLDKFGKVAITIPDKIVQRILIDDIPFGAMFSKGVARLPAKEGGDYLVDKNGNFSFTKERRREFDENGLEWFYGKEGYAILDKEGNYIIRPKKNLIGSSRNFLYTELEAKKGIYQFFDNQGKELFQIHADFIGGFRDDLAPINIGNKWGYINEKGEIKIPVKYNNAKEFSEGLAAVQKENKWGFIDRKGKFMILPKFDYVGGSYECGLAYVEKNGIEGYINKAGRWIWKKPQN